MSLSFNHIFDLKLVHNYFKGGTFKNVSFSMANETSGILRNLGLILKTFDGGISILSSDTELLKTSDKDEMPIRLYVSSTDPFFINYTFLREYDPLHSLLYFNNLTFPSFFPEGELVNEKNVALWSLGTFAVPSYDKEKKYFFKNANGTLISEEYIQKLQRPGEYRITNYSEGLISVYEESEKIFQIYYNPTTTWKKPFCVLEIYPSSLYEFTLEYAKQDCTIIFENRKTYWKYILVDPVYQKFKNLRIINGNKEPVFGPPKELVIHGKKAWVFDSLKEIPLQENYDSRLKLINESDSTPEDIKILPAASPNCIYQDNPTSKESMYSHIYL